MKTRLLTTFLVLTLVAAFVVQPGAAASAKYDINTLAGKAASLNGTAGLQMRFSALIEQEAEEEDATSSTAISPTYTLSSPLNGTSVLAPDVTVNQDTAAASQNETAIAV